jgi:hypothetical protein
MDSPSRLIKIPLATVLAAALGMWLLAPEAARIGPALASWTAWRQARVMDLESARSTLDALSKTMSSEAMTATGASWKFPTSSSGSRKSDADRLAWDRAAVSALSGAWMDAATGFGRAAGTGSTIPKEEAFFQLGNALYRLGETGEGGADKIGAWVMAVGSYGKSLSARFTDEAWNNREFVLKKLKEEIQKRQPQNDRPSSGGQGGGQAGPDDLRSLEQQMRDAQRRDQELRKWLRPDGVKPKIQNMPSELLRDLMGNQEGGVGAGEKKDW